MKFFHFIFIFCLFPILGNGQNNILRGKVRLEASSVAPLSNVKISALGANSVYSDDSGFFELIFSDKTSGESVSLTVEKDDFIVVNDKEIAECILRKNPEDLIEIIMTKKRKRIINSSLIKNEKEEFKSVFDSLESNTFKILILSFYNHDDEKKENCVGNYIHDYLKFTQATENLSIHPEYCDSIVSPIDEIEALKIRKRHNADFLIYGMFRPKAEYCNDLAICFMYSLAEEVAENLKTQFPVSKHKILIDTNAVSSTDIWEGKISLDINVITHWVGGLSFVKQSKLDKAIVQFEKIVNDFNYVNDEILKELGGLYFKTENYLETINVTSNLLQKDSNNIKLLNLRYESYNRLKKYKLAIVDIDKLIKIDRKKRLQYILIRGINYDNIGENEKSIADYTNLIENFNMGRVVYYLRGTVYQKSKQLQEAISDYNFCLNSKGINDNLRKLIYERRALTFRNLKEYEKSLEDYKKLIELEKDNSMHYYNMALSYLLISDVVNAFNTLEKGYTLDSSNKEIINLRRILNNLLTGNGQNKKP